jgi:hypothetical protein
MPQILKLGVGKGVTGAAVVVTGAAVVVTGVSVVVTGVPVVLGVGVVGDGVVVPVSPRFNRQAPRPPSAVGSYS